MPDSLPLWHLTERRVWTEALREGAYPWSTRGVSFEDEGFVHCCYPAQIATVVRAVYGNAPEPLVVVEIARGGLGSVPVRLEADPASGVRYPHLYGPLPLRAVVSVCPVHVLADGEVGIGEPEQSPRG